MTVNGIDESVAKLDAYRVRRSDALNGTVGPVSVEAEQNVLGSLLADPSQWIHIASMLKESDFSRPDHKLIWRAMSTLHSNGHKVDHVTVAEHLKLGGELDAAGGLFYLVKLARETLSPENCVSYASIVASHGVNRVLSELGHEIARTDCTPDEKIARLQTVIRDVDARRKPGEAEESLALVRGSDVRLERTDWLWNEWMACGCLQVFAGPAGLGKTTIALSLAAVLTRGSLWPDGSRCSQPGSVIFWSGEDAVDKTLMPRFVAMGGDPERIYFVDAVTAKEDGNLETREFDPSRDIPLLIEKANEIGDVRLLVVDPVSMCVAGDSNKNAEVRRGLAPLKAFAERHGAAVLGISHFSKGSEGRDPLSRVTGSLAFGAAPRLVLSAVTENPKPDEPEDAEPRHLFVRTKSNLGPTGDGFRYVIEQIPVSEGIPASRIVWGEHLKGNARELLADAEHVEADDGDRTEREDAKDFLRNVLDGDGLPAKQLFREYRDAGHSERTIRRAAKELGVQKIKQGMGGGWVWRMPKMSSVNPESTGQKTVATFGDRGHLRPELQENTPSKVATSAEDAEGGHSPRVRKDGHLGGQDREAF